MAELRGRAVLKGIYPSALTLIVSLSVRYGQKPPHDVESPLGRLKMT
jgi:hypothetical protein